ncbi:MAG: hypothetical protein OXR72_02850 [Gemmatimonadota bacterium]|nr:hypothetical protein [Gemmatimonadota bacterium]
MKKPDILKKRNRRVILKNSKPESTRETEDGTKGTERGVEDSPQEASSVLRRVADTAASAARGAFANAAGGTGVAARRVRAGGRKVWEVTASSAGQVMASTQALLPDSIAGDLNRMLEGMVQSGATIYDKAMDANYLDPLLKADLSGSYHRLFDGGHTISGAFNAARDALPDDTIIQEALGTIRGLLKDVTTIRGLPLANWDKETFERVAGALESKFHIPRDWFYDLNTYDAAELLAGALGAVAVVFSWNRADTETFAKIVGGMGLSASISANPLLLLVTLVALARSFHRARQTGEYTEFADGQFKGVIGAGSTLTAVGLVGVAGGPAGLALLAGLTAGILVNAATKNVSIVEVSQYAATETMALTSSVKGAAEAQLAGLKKQVVRSALGSHIPASGS